jgi:hypothetical protein
MATRNKNHLAKRSFWLVWFLCISFVWGAHPVWAQSASRSDSSDNRTPIQEGWIAGAGVRVQTLDKITARINTAEMDLAKAVRFGTLEITAHQCAYRPPEAPPETAAFLEINDIGYDQQNKAEKQRVFSGWMFASSPAISGLEHPVYDVTVLACLK